MPDQQIRLVFLGEAGQALAATNTVTTGVQRLSTAQKEQAATSRTVSAENTRASGTFQTLERDIGKSSRGALAGTGIFRGLGRSVAFASASFLGGYGLLAVIGSTVKVMKDASSNAAETEARIRATGGAAGVTAKQIDVLAVATMRKTGFDVEQVHAAENVLLTFTEVRNEVGRGNAVYTRAVGLTADLARAMKEDVSSAALQLGRALNDPIKGLTTLSRAGIQFTADQRATIKALVDSGQILEAQKLILDAVAGKVGGVASAHGDAASKVMRFRSEIRLLEEDLAGGLTPAFSQLIDEATAWVRKLEENKAAQQRFRDDVVGIAHGVGDVAHWLHLATEAVGGTKNAVELFLGLKFVGWLLEAKTALTGLIGTAAGAEAAAGGAGLLGAGAAARGLFGILSKLVGMAAAPIIITLVINRIIKDLTGYDALHNAVTTGTAGGAGDLLPVKRGGKWVDPSTGKPLNAAGQKYWNKQGGSAAPEMYPLASRGAIIGTPGQGTHSYTEGAGPGGFQWQDDQAVDITMKPGEAVLAAEDGVIGNDVNWGGDAGRFSGWGFQLMADSGSVYFYKHLKSMTVAAGDRVKQGEVLGHGTTTGHLHFAKQGAGSTAAVLGRNQGPPPAGSKPPRRGRGGNSGPSQLQTLDLALAQAGTTKTTTDDRAALQALIAYYKKQLANPNLPITTRIADLNTEGGYISQLDALAPKKASHASAAALVNIHHTLDAVAKLVDTAGLDKKFDPALAKINDELGSKFVTSETLAKIRNQLADISKAATAEIHKAAAAVRANKAAFAAAWAQLASDAFAAFDKETASHVGPTRAILNNLISEHDKAQIDQAVLDAKKALDDALAGVNSNADSQIVASIQALVGNAVLANAIDQAQSDILGGKSQQGSNSDLLTQLQQLLGAGGADPAAVAAAQKAYDEAIYQQKIFYLGLQADAEDSAYTVARQALRDALTDQLAAWDTYYQKVGEKASQAAADFAKAWARALSQFPGTAGGTGANLTTSTGAPFTPGSLGAQGYFLLNPPGQSAGDIPKAGQPIYAAGGADFTTVRPTLIVAGEGGKSEHVKISPRGIDSNTGGDGGVTHVHLSLGDGLDQLVTAQVIKAAPGVSVSIGREADRRRREGRR